MKPKKIGKRTSERFLIVCEDSKSSRFYFESKIREKRTPQYKIEVEVESSKHSAPTKVVEYAKNRLEESLKRVKDGEQPYKKIFCVMDVDDFFAQGVLQKAINEIDKQNKQNAESELVAVISNECFEIWYLLHFEEGKKVSRTEFKNVLSKYIKYEKSDSKIFEKIQSLGNETKAIERAKQLEKRYQKDSREPFYLKNPSTKVYEIVEKINELAK